ncbi:MAG: AAA family ATPase [Verrucomicrobiota bacterium]|nr:AAA family ATPase [Verrucomicrobiota bacterium]
MKKKIPYAIANFEQLQKGNYYYVDKTKFLEKLENYTTPVFLRPRHFGKTLLCSMQQCYYDIKRKDLFDELFRDTYIGKNPTPEKNKYMVLHLNFSSVQVSDDIKFIEHNFNEIQGQFLETFLHYYSEYFKDFKLNEKETFTNKLSAVVAYIEKNKLPQLYLIIDEYDNFSNQLITTNNDILYKKITSDTSFLKTFFKKLKEAIEMQTVKRVFITGVLPITIDDLSSGFNIAEIITLKSPFLNMLGFTQKEVDEYLDMVKKEYGFDEELTKPLRAILKNFYNGSQFASDSETLYNSTIISYFLKNFIMEDGKIPTIFIDTNLKTDISWIKKLTIKEANTKEMLEKIIYQGELSYDMPMLSEKFNMSQFFEPIFYPISLFYLGMLTIKSDFRMKIPNQMMQAIFAEYFNEIEKFNVSNLYADDFEQFLRDLDLEKLFKAYWDLYISQFSAQMFDKANENFFRTTFYELCRRHLSQHFVFEIEVNRHSGRADWELLGKPTSPYKYTKYLAEFKHFSNKDKKIFENLKEPREKDQKQLDKYADNILKEFPEYTLTTWMIYTFAGKQWKILKSKR